MAKRYFYSKKVVLRPRSPKDPNGAIEQFLLDEPTWERTRYEIGFIGSKWWKIVKGNPLVEVSIPEPHMLIDRSKSKVFTDRGEVTQYLLETLRSRAVLILDTSEDRHGQWDVNQLDFASVWFDDPQEAVLFKLRFG